jgi:chromatin-remodeling ATPase INO80
MTGMIDLMEEYMIFRQYKYLRLDGDTHLEDRRDMVIDWQQRYGSQIPLHSLILIVSF